MITVVTRVVERFGCSKIIKAGSEQCSSNCQSNGLIDLS